MTGLCDTIGCAKIKILAHPIYFSYWDRVRTGAIDYAVNGGPPTTTAVQKTAFTMVVLTTK